MKQKFRARTVRGFIIPCIGVALGGCALVGSTTEAVDETGSEAWQEARYQRGKLLLSLGNYGLSIEAFRDVIRHAPNSVRSLNGIAAAYDMLGRYDLAQRYYKEALLIEPKSVETLNNQGYSYILAGRFDKARQSLSKAAEVEGKNSNVLANLKFLNRREALAKTSINDAARRAVAEEKTKAPNIKSNMWVERASQGVQVLITRPDSAMVAWARSNQIKPRWLHNEKNSAQASYSSPAILSLAPRGAGSLAFAPVPTLKPDELPPVISAPSSIVSGPQILTSSSGNAKIHKYSLKSVSGSVLSSASVPAKHAMKPPINLTIKRSPITALQPKRPTPDLESKVGVISAPHQVEGGMASTPLSALHLGVRDEAKGLEAGSPHLISQATKANSESSSSARKERKAKSKAPEILKTALMKTQEPSRESSKPDAARSTGLFVGQSGAHSEEILKSFEPRVLYKSESNDVAAAFKESQWVNAGVELHGYAAADFGGLEKLLVPFKLKNQKSLTNSHPISPSPRFLEIINVSGDELVGTVVQDRLKTSERPMTLVSANYGDVRNKSVMRCRPGYEEAAQKLLGSIDMSLPIEINAKLGADLQLVVGDDIFTFDKKRFSLRLLAQAFP